MPIFTEEGTVAGAGDPRVPAPVGTGVGETLGDGDDVVRLGDGHVSGVESLCVGESQ